jgi:hypothetical protein
MALISGVPVAEAASEAGIEAVPDGSRPVSCPKCHTPHPSLTHDALQAGGNWRCTRCGQHWDARRLATVAAFAAWVAAQDTTARMRDTAPTEGTAPLPEISEALPE